MTQQSTFTQAGNHFFSGALAETTIHSKLPAGNYTICFNPKQGYFLERAKSFPKPGKTYGSVGRQVKRILTHYAHTQQNLGVMLTGEKGSGKSLTAKEICRNGEELGIPTLIITSPMAGDDFFRFLSTITQPVIILIDGFEKTYDRDEQPALLTLLDGVFPSKKLWLLTCNDHWKVDSHMRNRPGRLHYMMEFKGLDMKFIEEYANDNLDDKSQITGLIQVLSFFEVVCFDVLRALVLEMNMFKESAVDAIEMLNAKPSSEGNTKMSLKVTHLLSGVTWTTNNPDGFNVRFESEIKSPLAVNTKIYTSSLEGRQLARSSVIQALSKEQFAALMSLEDFTEDSHEFVSLWEAIQNKGFTKECDDSIVWQDLFRNQLTLSSANLISVDHERGVYRFSAEKGFVIEMAKEKVQQFSMRSAMDLIA